MTSLVRPGIDAYFEVVDGNIRIHSGIELAALCKSIPNRRWSKRGYWESPATPSTVANIAEIFAGKNVECDEAFYVLYEMSQQAEEGRQLRDREDLEDHRSKLPSWMHQRRAFQFGSRLQGLGLWADMGTGKSKVVVDLIANKNLRLVLIVAPTKPVKVWARQFREFYAGPVDPEVIVLDSRLTLQQRAQSIENMRQWTHQRPIIFVTNYQSFNTVVRNPAFRSSEETPGVQRYLPNPMQEALLNTPWDMVVADEAHNLKGPKSTLCDLFAQLPRFVPFRVGLSGTPTGKSPLGAWGVYRFLDPGIFPKHYGAFRRQYAIMDPRFPSKVVAYHNLDDFNRRMYSIAFRVTADILDLPEYHHVYRYVKLGPRANKLYIQMMALGAAANERGDAVTNNTLTKYIRMAQITSGFLPMVNDDEEGIIEDLEPVKRDELESILDEVPNLPLREGQLEADPEPVVVFCRFARDLDAVKTVAERLGRRYAELSGRMDTVLDEDGRMRPGIDVAAVQIQAGGAGVDLTRARYAVYYSKDYSLINYEQSLKRLHRPGQNRPDPANPGKALPVVFYHIVASKTVDILVERSLRDSTNLIEMLWDACQNGAEIGEEI